MKIWLILVILLVIPGVLADSKSVSLFQDESYFLDNHNLTVLGFDTEKDDKVLLCVDGQRTIISQDKTKIVNGLSVEVRSITSKLVKLNLESIQDLDEYNEHLNDKCYQEIAVNTREEEEDVVVSDDVEVDIYNVPSNVKEDSLSFSQRLIKWILSVFR